LKVKEYLGEAGHGKVNCKAVSEQMNVIEVWGSHAQDSKKDPDTLYHSQALEDIVFPPRVVLGNATDDFDPQCISIHAEASPVGVAMKAFLDSIGGWPAEAVATNCKWLTKHPKKNGCTGPCPMPSRRGDGECFLPGWDDELQCKQGAQAGISSVRANVHRSGPSAWPLCGIGCFATGIETFWVQVVALSDVLDNGFVAGDIVKFLETGVGSQIYMGEEATSAMVKVPAKSTVFIPYGFMALPLTMAYRAAEKKDKVGNIMCVPVFNVEWFKHVSVALRTAIHTLNADYLVKQSSDFYTTRSSFFAGFCKDAGIDVK
jgi:hypothetical protein